MGRLTVSENKRTLLKNNKPFFYLADTCWSAFTNIRENDWIEYLRKRKYQGFNTLQINILAQWDRSASSLDYLPFASDENGKFDFSKLKDDYFEHAKRYVTLAHQAGFELSLVVLWSNYVSGTWASELATKIGKADNIFPQEYLEQYFAKVIETFDEFQPIYVIGGDTDFITDVATQTYLRAFDYFSVHSPETLKTIHVKGRFTEIPTEIEKLQDLYFYQSGHNSEHFEMPYLLAEDFYKKKPQLPIVNSEPCYEQMGYSRNVYGRFTRFDIRKAAWQSVLSGACAGLTYGAHGIWSWQESNSSFSSEIGEAFDVPVTWMEALNFLGATDYGFIRQFLEFNGLSNLVPAQDLLVNADPSIRVARDAEQGWVLVYLPSNTSIKLDEDFSNAAISLIDLENNHFFKPEYQVEDGKTVFSIHNAAADVLLIIKR